MLAKFFKFISFYSLIILTACYQIDKEADFSMKVFQEQQRIYFLIFDTPTLQNPPYPDTWFNFPELSKEERLELINSTITLYQNRN